MQELQQVILDTNTLIDGVDLSLFSKIYLPITIVEELDKIKHNSEGERQYKARKAIKQIKEATNIEYKLDYSYSLPIWLGNSVPDNRILGFSKEIALENPGAVLVSRDYNMLIKGRALGLKCEEYKGDNKDEIYTGYKEISLSQEELAEHYQNPINRFRLLNNEYLIIKDSNGEIIDKQKWIDDKGFSPVSSKPFKSIYFPDFKPRDTYQMLAMDSLIKDEFTLLFGKAGSSKTYISLSWIMQNIHTSKINKCVIIFNPAKLRNNEQLGYYSGSRIEKLLQNSIGGILSSKFGDMTLVESLINNGKLMIIPTSDIRGIEISENDCLYVTEAQNTDAYTMRTIIQRAKEGCKIIIEGDMLEQQDIRNCKENGMMRIIDVFKGTKHFSCVKLKNVYRSPIAELAQNI